MKTTTPVGSDEILHVLRGLSHDMGAAHMMLDHSFRRLKTLLESARSENPQVRQHLAHVEACVDAAKGYLDDMTRLSTSGAAEMEPEPVEVAGIVDQILVEQATLLEDRGVEVRGVEPLPVVWCNARQLKQVLTNLVRNAVLHGCDPVRPRVVLQGCTPADGDDTMAAVRVHDNGPGIDPRRRREIFLPGCRLDGSEASGSGWGLPTSRRIAERFGGSLVLDSDCPSGTAFLLALPDASDALCRRAVPTEAVEEGRQWRLQLDARHRGPLRHGHSQLASDECRVTRME